MRHLQISDQQPTAEQQDRQSQPFPSAVVDRQTFQSPVSTFEPSRIPVFPQSGARLFARPKNYANHRNNCLLVDLAVPSGARFDPSASDIRHRIVAVVPLLVLLVSGRCFWCRTLLHDERLLFTSPFYLHAPPSPDTLPTRANDSVSSGLISVVHFFRVSRLVENRFSDRNRKGVDNDEAAPPA